MATITRQPFAPLDGARLQTLTSLKNRQNAVPANASVKRKAEAIDTDDFENIDPSFFSKRSKAGFGDNSLPGKDLFKASSFILTKAASVSNPTQEAASSSSRPASVSPAVHRTFLQPKSPTAKLNTSLTIKATPLSAPAGRSPTRGSKRIGILSNRRRTSGPFSRIDPPSFGLGSSAPFSLDAALKGTIPSYSGRTASTSEGGAFASLHEPEIKSGWFFDIHEDTPEQEMTNLLQHGTCTLDISSDEESERNLRRDRAEGRDKENIPPADDISQTSSAAASAAGRVADNDDMLIEKSRGPLAEMNAADYYAAGCDESSVIIVPGDDEETQEPAEETAGEVIPEVVVEVPEFAHEKFEFAPEIKLPDVQALMGEHDPAIKAAVLQPIEGTGESFDLWESGSAKDDAEPVPASPAAADVNCAEA